MRPVFFFPRATILDCGASRTILAVISGGRKGQLRLEQFAVATHSIEPGPEGSWLAKTTEALSMLRARVKPAGTVTVILPPHLTLMKMLNTPRVAAAKRDKIINFEGQQSIPYPLSEVVWDRLISGENSHSLNVLLCAAKLDVLDPISAAVATAGFVPSFLVPSARALAACYMETQPEQAMPTLLIALGARSTTLVLLDKNSFQARSLSLGGFGITQQIAEAQACDFTRAEELKLSGSHDAEIEPSVRLFTSRLAQEITRTLGHFHRPLTAENPLRLMLTGGSARLPGLAGLLANQMNLPVTLFDVVGAIEIGREAGDFRREEHGSAVADIIGGAALQFRAAQTPLNLLPPRLRQQAGRRRLRPWLAVAAGLAVAGMIPAVVHYHRVLDSAQVRNVTIERELAPLRLTDARDQERRQRQAETQRQLEAWRKIEKARTGWLNFLGEIQARFNQTGDVWLERMQTEPSSTENEASRSSGGPPLRIAFSGLMRPKTGFEQRSGAENYQRVRSLLEDIATATAVAAVESERFEPAPSGLLRFDFVVVLKDSAAL